MNDVVEAGVGKGNGDKELTTKMWASNQLSSVALPKKTLTIAKDNGL